MEDSKKSGRDTLWKILVCVALLVFLVSGGLTLRSYLADKRAQEEYERLAREAAQTTQETITIEETEKQELETEPEKEEYQSPYDFDTLKKENPDTIGWIHIPDTKISYPIVQGTDNDFYLKHDFNGEASVAGSIYLDYESEGDFEGRNNILYGHNMKNGSMFKDIVRYKDPSYFKEHQYFSIYTPEREIRLKAVSCYYGEAKPIVRKTRFKSQEAFDEFVKECGNQNNWTASTYEKFAAVRNHIKEFKEDVTFEYFNEFGLNEYVNFLRDKKDMRNSTIGKQMGFLKWFLRWSFKKGHHQNIAYDAFKPKLKTTPKKVIFLTWDELNKLKDYHIPHDKQYLERVRDVFLFCCFTSLRYSDVRNLKRSDIKPDHIEVTTVKTADSLIIELNDHSKAILEKYKDVHFENHMALPVISNQKMNDYLKELGELAEINEPVRETYYKGNERIDEVTPKYALLSTHAGRKTFICNALALGIPAPVVMKWTGHSDYKAMKPYIDIADDIRANAMNKFNQL